MRRFTTICIDNETKMRMIYACCGYNEACFQLEHENRNGVYGKLKDVSKVGKLDKIEYDKATFYFDEERGCLLKEVD